MLSGSRELEYICTNVEEMYLLTHIISHVKGFSFSSMGKLFAQKLKSPLGLLEAKECDFYDMK